MDINTLSTKQTQFNAAMALYESKQIYKTFGMLVATSNVSLQVLLIIRLWEYPLNLGYGLLAFFLAFIMADLVNGLIHMFMDHREDYDAFYGPFVANFHLHHHTPKYKKRALPLVYFHESGAKIWLVLFQVPVLIYLQQGGANSFLAHTLVYFSVLSSVAEVSHYLCHTSSTRVTHILGQMGILLSREHHTPHHEKDNCNYAFLNGMTDPLINRIARVFYTGYKKTTDLHFSTYTSVQHAHR